MKQKMEKISILSLSLMLISTYSVSAALPAMQEYYAGYSRAAVEQLVSITSFAMTVVIILNTWLTRILSQRLCITLGLILLTAGGSAPLFAQNYGFAFVTRVLLGTGIGLVNSHAINMINERYEGDERANLLGYRSAMEVLGNAVLTLIAGWLLPFGWPKAFAVYLAALLILVLYLCFVPEQKKVSGKTERKDTAMASDIKKYMGVFISTLAFGFFTICINSCITMRIPVLTLERQMGTDAQSSLVLSLMMVTGIVAGVLFGKMVQLLGGKLTGVCMLVLSLSLVLISGSNHMFSLTAGAMICGLAYNFLATIVFHRVSSKLPQSVMSIGTTCGLVGCNMGAFSAPYVMKLIELVNEGSHVPLVVFAVLSGILGVAMLVKNMK